MPATAPYKIIDERTDTPPPHPGEILREDVLPYFKVTASELTRHLDVPLAALSGILSERAPVDRSIAVLLGGSLGRGADYWLALQLQYDIWHNSLGQRSG